MSYDFQKEFEEAMDAVYEYEKEIEDFNSAYLSQFSRYQRKKFDEMVDGCAVTGKIEYVDGPKGNPQREKHGVFRDIHVKQFSSGDGGDTFYGQIYANVNGQWISIPYSC